MKEVVMNTYCFEMRACGTKLGFKPFYEDLPRSTLEEHSYTFSMEHFIPAGGNWRNPSPETVRKRRELWGTTSDIFIDDINVVLWLALKRFHLKGRTNANPPVLFFKELGRRYPEMYFNMQFLSYDDDNCGRLIIRDGIVIEYVRTQDPRLFHEIEEDMSE